MEWFVAQEPIPWLDALLMAHIVVDLNWGFELKTPDGADCGPTDGKYWECGDNAQVYHLFAFDGEVDDGSRLGNRAASAEPKPCEDAHFLSHGQNVTSAVRVDLYWHDQAPSNATANYKPTVSQSCSKTNIVPTHSPK
jgi:hypothetical protein